MGKLYHCPKMGMKYNTILDPKSGVIQAKQHHLISGLRRQSNKISPISFVPRLKQIRQRENNLKYLKMTGFQLSPLSPTMVAWLVETQILDGKHPVLSVDIPLKSMLDGCQIPVFVAYYFQALLVKSGSLIEPYWLNPDLWWLNMVK